MRSERLNRIIELKGQLMEEKERLLEQHNSKARVLSNYIRTLSADIENNYSKLCTKCLDGNEFFVIRNYIEHLDRLKLTAVEQKEQVEKKITAIRAELVEMLREIKTLSTLKDKALSAARKIANKKQQKLLDEIALRLEGRES
jgi:flagellar export protein FliJ